MYVQVLEGSKRYEVLKTVDHLFKNRVSDTSLYK